MSTEEAPAAGAVAINALVPEFAVIDARASLGFYCDVLGFEVVYERPEEGFAFLSRGDAQLMLYEIGLDRTLAVGDAPLERPLGRGVNLQIQVEAIEPLTEALKVAGIGLYLPPEERWYRAGDHELGVRQFAVADPDGYLLRFSESIGTRPAGTSVPPGRDARRADDPPNRGG